MISFVVSKLSHFSKTIIKPIVNKQIFMASFDCNNCSKKTTLPQCTACHRMVNYFNIFNMQIYSQQSPQQYKVNEQVIATKAKELQKQYHPDKHSFNEEMEKFFKDNMEKYSAYINEAKATLLDDLKRAIYMMQLRGVDIEDSNQIQDNNFMLEMFSLQEEIEQGDRDACEEIKRRVEGVMRNLQGQFDNFFRSEDMNKCKEFVFKYKYLNRALQNVNKKLNAMQASH